MDKLKNKPKKISREQGSFSLFLKFVLFYVICATLTSSFEPIDFRPCVYEESSEISELPITEDILALQERIDSIFETYNSYKFKYGIKVIALDSYQTIYEVNHTDSFIPASNLKVLTTAAGFHFLTPNYRWKTNFFVNFDGDLYITPSGDPTWNDKYYGLHLNYLFSAIADSLAKHPNLQINNVILEKGTFNDYKMDYFWKTNNFLQTYSARPSHFAFYNNSIQLKIEPTTVGKKADITLFPVNAGFEVVNNVYTIGNRTSQPLSIIADSLSNHIVVVGSIYNKSKPQFRSIATPMPDDYALTVFREKFNEFEINYSGQVYYDHFSERDFKRHRFEHLFSLPSATVTEVATDINKWSNNFIANQLFLTIGESERHVWQTENIIKEWLISNNIPIHDLKLFDGSGLSHYNQISPDVLVNVLKFVYNSPYFEEYLSTLPISGIDGTLRRSLNSYPLRGEVIAKTGYVLGARGLTGFVRTADGELFAFSFIANRPNSNLSFFYEIAEQVLTELVLFQRVNYEVAMEEESNSMFGYKNWRDLLRN